MKKFTKSPVFSTGQQRTLSEILAEHIDFYYWRYCLSPLEITQTASIGFVEEVEELALKEGLPVTLICEFALKFGEGHVTGYTEEEKEGLTKEGWNFRAISEVYHSPLPDNVTEAQMNQHLETGYHAFIEHKGKFFDAECVSGVTNLFDLPFYQRYLATIPKEG